MKNLQFWPESLGAMLEYWYIERGLFFNIPSHFIRGVWENRLKRAYGTTSLVPERPLIYVCVCPKRQWLSQDYSLLNIMCCPGITIKGDRRKALIEQSQKNERQALNAMVRQRLRKYTHICAKRTPCKSENNGPRPAYGFSYKTSMISRFTSRAFFHFGVQIYSQEKRPNPLRGVYEEAAVVAMFCHGLVTKFFSVEASFVSMPTAINNEFLRRSIKPSLVKMLQSILLAVFNLFTSILIALLDLYQRQVFCTTFSLKHLKHSKFWSSDLKFYCS